MSEYLDFSKRLANQAGDIMRHYYMGGDLAIELKDDQSRVTIADKAVNDMVIEEVAQAYPEHSVRGEEASNQEEGDEYVWVCDPIDGTFPYSVGMALGMFSLALVHDGKPITALAFEPISNKLYTAELGEGAFLNGSPISVSGDALKPKTRVDVCDQFNNKIADLRATGTALYEQDIKLSGYRNSVNVGTLVADGSLAAAITSTKHPHDIAAVKLIIEEAGGKVTDLWGDDQRYDGFIKGALMSNGVVHQELVDIIRQNT